VLASQRDETELALSRQRLERRAGVCGQRRLTPQMVLRRVEPAGSSTELFGDNDAIPVEVDTLPAQRVKLAWTKPVNAATCNHAAKDGQASLRANTIISHTCRSLGGCWSRRPLPARSRASGTGCDRSGDRPSSSAKADACRARALGCRARDRTSGSSGALTTMPR
jgi:hypothetical protein